MPQNTRPRSTGRSGKQRNQHLPLGIVFALGNYNSPSKGWFFPEADLYPSGFSSLIVVWEFCLRGE